MLLGQAGGTFATATVTTLPGPEQTLDVAVGQLTADTNPDVVVTTGKANVVVFGGDGAGGLGSPVYSPVAGNSTAVALADVNGDGKTDMAVSTAAAKVSVLLASAQGGSFAAQVPYGAGATPTGVALADLTGDGKPELLAGSGDGTLTVRTGPAFATEKTYVVGGDLRDVAVADLNADGQPDVVTTRDSGVSLLLNNGDGTLTAPTTLAGAATRAVTIADADGDGRPDLATAGTGLVLRANTTARSRASAQATSVRRAQTVTYTADGAPMSKVRLYVKVPGATAFTLAAEQPATSDRFDYKVATDGPFAYFTTLVDADGNEETKPATADATTQVTLTRSLTAESLSFAAQLLNTSSAPAEAHIVNTGEATLTLKAPSVSGSDFALTSDECTGATLKPEDECLLRIVFTPTAPGVRSARVTLDAGTLDLEGAGVSPPVVLPAPLPPPALPAAPAKIGAKLVFTYKRGKLRTLSVRNVPKGATVKATRGKTTYIKRKASGTVSLARLVKKTGAKIVVTVSKPGMTSVTHTLTVKTRKLRTR